MGFSGSGLPPFFTRERSWFRWPRFSPERFCDLQTIFSPRGAGEFCSERKVLKLKLRNNSFKTKVLKRKSENKRVQTKRPTQTFWSNSSQTKVLKLKFWNERSETKGLITQTCWNITPETSVNKVWLWGGCSGRLSGGVLVGVYFSLPSSA